jgi:hypothetical protein
VDPPHNTKVKTGNTSKTRVQGGGKKHTLKQHIKQAIKQGTQAHQSLILEKEYHPILG